jgi:hypothetical protein
MADSNTHESLIGKLAPSFTLPNYDGEPFTFVPGEKGIPTAIFVYPVARMICFLFHAFRIFSNIMVQSRLDAPKRLANSEMRSQVSVSSPR